MEKIWDIFLNLKVSYKLSLDLPKDTQFGFSLNHMSNARLRDKNPGTDNYMFNFFKNFNQNYYEFK